jgi:hypothetical protein
MLEVAPEQFEGDAVSGRLRLGTPAVPFGNADGVVAPSNNAYVRPLVLVSFARHRPPPEPFGFGDVLRSEFDLKSCAMQLRTFLPRARSAGFKPASCSLQQR